MTGAKVDHRIRCMFTRRIKFSERIFDLDEDYYLLVAKGRADKRGLDVYHCFLFVCLFFSIKNSIPVKL